MTWVRETIRGTVSSLVAPALLLAAALIVAIGGSGADALSSLGQLTKGPDVPPTPVEMVSREAPVGADVGELDGRLVASAGARAAQSSRGARARQGGGGSAPPASGATSAGGSTPSSAVSRGPGSPGGTSGQSGAQPGTTPSAPAPGAPPSSPSPSAPSAQPNPVADVLDQTQQLGNDLLKPVKPLTDQVLGGLPR